MKKRHVHRGKREAESKSAHKTNSLLLLVQRLNIAGEKEKEKNYCHCMQLLLLS